MVVEGWVFPPRRPALAVSRLVVAGVEGRPTVEIDVVKDGVGGHDDSGADETFELPRGRRRARPEAAVGLSPGSGARVERDCGLFGNAHREKVRKAGLVPPLSVRGILILLRARGEQESWFFGRRGRGYRPGSSSGADFRSD